MPEGPDLAIAASYIRRICDGKIFSRIEKSSVSKCADIPWKNDHHFKIFAVSRGKELMLSMEPSCSTTQFDRKYILFHFGMTGRFNFTPYSTPTKHSHLRFITTDGAESLNFVDPRRFGKWELKNSPDDWSPERGPCPVREYSKFRDRISRSLDDSVFNRPLCEAMLDQRYFNGIGNYLRAEIIFRSGVPPFEKARTVLSALFDKTNDGSGSGDLLDLCKSVQEEVINMYNPESFTVSGYLSDNDGAFDQWLRCYGKQSMKRLLDANRRTIWFYGPAGVMANKKHTRRTVRRKRVGAEAHTVAKEESVESKDELECNDQTGNHEGRRAKRRRITIGMNEETGKDHLLAVGKEYGQGVLTRSRVKLLSVERT